MGRYFGLSNLSKHHNVSHYWKNNPPEISELNNISVIFGWNLEKDIIVSYSYCNRYKYFNNQQEWIDQAHTIEDVDAADVDAADVDAADVDAADVDAADVDAADVENVKNIDNGNTIEDYESINVGYNPNHDVSVKQDVAANIVLYKKSFDSLFFGC